MSNALIYKITLIKNEDAKVKYKAFNNNNELCNFIDKLNESKNYTEIDDYKIDKLNNHEFINTSLKELVNSDTSLQDFISIIIMVMKNK